MASALGMAAIQQHTGAAMLKTVSSSQHICMHVLGSIVQQNTYHSMHSMMAEGTPYRRYLSHPVNTLKPGRGHVAAASDDDAMDASRQAV